MRWVTVRATLGARSSFAHMHNMHIDIVHAHVLRMCMHMHMCM